MQKKNQVQYQKNPLRQEEDVKTIYFDILLVLEFIIETFLFILESIFFNFSYL